MPRSKRSKREDLVESPDLVPSDEAGIEKLFQLGMVDAVEWLRGLPDESVDLIVTDVAYESLEKHRAVGTTTRLKRWFKIFPNARFGELFAEMYRVMKRDTHLYFMCDSETMFVAKPIGEEHGFRFWKPIVWDKVYMGGGYHYRAQTEFVLFFEKGKRALNSKSITDIIRIKSKRDKGRYPTQKPEELMEVLIGQSTSPGDLVIDPFMGSGSVGAAAMSKQRCFAGNDISQDSIDCARARLLELGGQEVAGIDRRLWSRNGEQIRLGFDSK